MLTKKISSVRYPKSYKVGTGPFCSASDADCMPGYVFKNKHDKGCWTGIKGECVFDVDEYKRTGTYARIAEEKGKKFADENIPSAYFVYGTAPICGGSFCDVVKDNKFPIGMTESGGGSKCLTGSKAIGIEPVAKFQFDLIEKWKSECREDENKARDMWIEGFKTANKAMGAITGPGGNYRNHRCLRTSYGQRWRHCRDGQPARGGARGNRQAGRRGQHDQGCNQGLRHCLSWLGSNRAVRCLRTGAHQSAH
jgi:hypothetical protein